MSETDSTYPWIRFFPADHFADAGLRLSSFGARGLWSDMLCLMYGGEPHGYLCRGGKPMTVPQLARLVGGAEEEVARHLDELRFNGVFSEDDIGIYSRRMLRDEKKRAKDQANGRKGGNPELMPRVKRGVNRRDNAQSPEARVQRSKAIDQKSEGRSAVTVSVSVPVRPTVDEFASEILELVRAHIPVEEANQIIVAEHATRWLGFGWEQGTILETIRSVLARPRDETKQFSLFYFERVIEDTPAQIARIRGRQR